MAQLLVTFLLSGALPAQEAEEIAKLEAKLPEVNGSVRIDLLIELTQTLAESDPKLAVAYGEKGREQLEASPDPAREISLLSALALASFRSGNSGAALHQAERAVALARAAGDESRLVSALWVLGLSLQRLDQRSRALAVLTEASELGERLGDAKQLGRVLNTSGIIYMELGDLYRAMELYVRSHKLFEQAGAHRERGKVHNNIGIVHTALQQYEKAAESYGQSLAIQRQFGNETNVALVLKNLGETYRSLGDPENAVEAHLQALEIRRKLGDPRLVALVFRDLGADHVELGEFAEAERYYRQALEILDEHGSKVDRASALNAFGVLLQKRGRLAESQEALETALALAREAKHHRRSKLALRDLVDTYRALSFDRKALEAMIEYEAVLLEELDAESRNRLVEMEARFSVEHKQKEIEHLKQQHALQALELERQREARWALVIGFGLVLVIVGLLFNRFRLQAKGRLMAAEVEHERAVSAQLREVDKLKDDLLATTSHELRTPLYGITGLAESMIESGFEVSEEIKAHLRMIVASGRRLTSLVNNILDFSKLRHRGLKLSRKAVDLHALTEDALGLCRPLAAGKSLELRSTLDPDLPLVDADEDRLRQVLLNLIGNAVKFTADGHVEVSARVAEGEIEVSVVDTGPGIPEDQWQRIFDPFEQLDASTDRKYGGSGLGLAISRRLIELHGGDLWIDSTIGQGSTFTFTLSLASGPPTILPAAETKPAAADPSVAVSEPAEQGIRILVVDDEPINRLILGQQLKSHGFTVVEAVDGPQALAILRDKKLDLVLLDVMMPHMSGYEVCRELRRNHDARRLPVIFVTAKDGVEDRVAGFAAGGNDYLTKPVALEELLARVRTHLALSSSS